MQNRPRSEPRSRSTRGHTPRRLRAVAELFALNEEDIVLGGAALEAGLLVVTIAVLVAIGWVPGLARMTRGITLEATTREFVQAAEVLGYRRRTILFGVNYKL